MSELNPNPRRTNLLADAVNAKPDESIRGYTRAVRRKLYFLFAMLILVMIMMNEARKPENWMWMGFKPAANNAEAIVLDGLENQTSDDDQIANNQAAGSLATGAASSSKNENANLSAGSTSFWNRVWESLETEDKTALVELIYLSQRNLDDRDVNLADFDPLVSSLRQASPGDASYRDKWESTIQPGLLGVARGEDLTIGQQGALKELFKTLDPLILAELDDFTSPGRKVDMPAWHRYWGRVLEDNEQDEAQSVSPVQLVAQSDVWRFQPIRIRGRLLAGRAKEAGIHGPLRQQGVWYEWWIGNTHGSDEVWCIYTADKPVSIEVGEKFEKFDMPIECNGLFYKVRSYVDAESKGNHCPLILANTFSVTQKVNPIAEATWLPSMPVMIASILGVMAIAFGIAMLVHRSDKHRIHQPGGEHKLQIESHLDTLSNDPEIKSVAERLEELE